jgi:hypothetical protein
MRVRQRCVGPAVWRTVAMLAWLVTAAPPSQAALRCHDSAAFRVVERTRDDGPGADFLVQPVQPGPAMPACSYQRMPGDFEIPSRDAESFAALVGTMLVIDNGTGPDRRRLILWNLQRREQVLDTPLGAIIEVTPQRLSYWRPDEQPANDTNCPRRRRWQAQLLGARMERKVSLDLRSMTPQTLNRWRCVSVQ